MSAPIDILANRGFPPGILKSLRKDGITHLLAPQVEAVAGFDLLGKGDLLVALPTSCGKTLIGELAGVGTALKGERAIFSVPLKAIAREKYETFQRRYARYGLRVRMATGEFTEHLQDLNRGGFDLAVVIHEKLKHLILQNPRFLSGVGVVVLDELQGVTEQNRGPDLEFLLGLLKSHRPRVRRVGLAGKLASTDPLIEDFGGRVMSTHLRPVDLQEGIVLSNDALAETALAEYDLGMPIGEGKVCIYRSHNSQEVGAIRLPVADIGVEERGTFLGLAAGLARSGESVLLFLSTRRETEQAAILLAQSIGSAEVSPSEEEIESIRHETLANTLRSGVAFHHADCSARTRSRVEEWFRSGKVRVLCCTSTLAQGVNLPAHHVLIHPYVWNRGDREGELALLDEGSVRNMAGRAGRLGFGTQEGRALLVAHSEREWDLYRSLYWTDRVPESRPTLLKADMGSYLLAGIASGFGREESLKRLMGSLLSYRSIEGTGRLERSLRERLEDAERLGLSRCSIDGDLDNRAWSLTPLGKVVALRGLGFETGRFLSDWLDRLEGQLPCSLTLLYAVCSCAESREWNWPRENNPQVRARWCEEIRHRVGEETLWGIGGETWDTSLSDRLEEAARMAMVLESWGSGDGLDRIRQQLPGVSEGLLQSLGEGARWLLESLADIWRAKGFPHESAEEIQRLARSTGTGLPAWADAWNLVPSDLLDREEKLRLAGILSSPFHLLQTGTRNLVKSSVPDTVLDRVVEFLQTLRGRKRGGRAVSVSPLPESDSSGRGNPILSVDLSEKGNRFRVEVCGNPVYLGIRNAELLLRFVRQRCHGGTEGWVSKEDLGILPENLSQRISDLRQRLGPPPNDRDTWIESDRKGHYRLTLKKEEIRWNERSVPRELTALIS